MTMGWTREGRTLRQLAAAAVLGGLCLSGCGKQAAVPDASEKAPASAENTAPAPAQGTAALPASEAIKPATPPAGHDRLHQAFADATRPEDNPPAGSNRPPDETVTHRSVYKILKEVKERWDGIRFTTPEGKKIDYSATIETSLGTLRLALLPELAPNHVRNFVALAEAGYYDGLLFDRIRHENSGDDNPGPRSLELIEGGCPLGTGEPGNGSIGYWLKDEIQPGEKITHDEGVIGACPAVVVTGADGEIEADTTGCRFYINLNKAPYLDGQDTIFGKVAQETLDVARKIYQQPVIVDDQDRDGARRPENPVVIRKVTIQRHEQP